MDLADGCIWRHHELRLAGLLEHEVQHAVLQLDLEALTVRQRQKRTPCGFERFVALYAKFLFRDDGHGPIKPSRGSSRLNIADCGLRIADSKEVLMREWSFSASAEWVVGFLLVVAIIAAAFV